MLSDHENLLSTFGKDSQSSNRKSRQIEHMMSQRIQLMYDVEPKSRYQQILNQRKTLMMLQKNHQSNGKLPKGSKKLKTQSDIDYLNNRIRKSISGIAQSICKSKIKSTVPSRCAQFEAKGSSIKKLSQITKQSIQSHKYLKNHESKKLSAIQKENININYCQDSKRNYEKNQTKQEYLKNSTKKKGKFFDNQVAQCQIKSSFSIDLNSDSETLFQSSRKHFLERKCSKFNLLNDKMAFDDIKRPKVTQTDRVKKDMFQKKRKGLSQVNLGKQMEETLKKQFKHLAQSNYVSQPKFQESQGIKINDYQNQKSNQQFLFYQAQRNSIELQNQQKSPNFNNIEFPSRSYNLESVRRNLKASHDQLKREKQSLTKSNVNHHKLIQALQKQIELDFDLRHAKHMFSGIEEPFYAMQSTLAKCKWQRLNQELNNLGLYYSVDTIKKIFLPSEQELDPFLSVAKPHQELIYSLIYAYETSEIHWQQQIFQKWQHWDLRDIDLTIQSIDRERKGYLNVADIAAFISMQTGNEYKNRDVILIYKRLVNGFASRRGQPSKKNDQEKSFETNITKSQAKLKFRALIDCLIKPF